MGEGGIVLKILFWSFVENCLLYFFLILHAGFVDFKYSISSYYQFDNIISPTTLQLKEFWFELQMFVWKQIPGTHISCPKAIYIVIKLAKPCVNIIFFIFSRSFMSKYSASYQYHRYYTISPFNISVENLTRGRWAGF